MSKMFAKKVQAVKWANKTEADLERQLHPNSKANEATVQQLIDKYLEDITPRKKSAEDEVSRCRMISKYLGHYRLDKLTPHKVVEYAELRLDDVSSDSVRKELSILSVIINAGMSLWGIELPANPVTTASGMMKFKKTLKPKVHRERRPTPEELETLYKHAPNAMPLLIEYAVETCMRRGEIAGQLREHRNGNILHIPETKTSTPRTIPLSPRACEILDSLPDQDPVWGMRPDSITQAFNRTCDRLGIIDLRVHDLRHEGTSRLFEKNLDVMEVAHITGHKDLRVLKRYTHLKPEDIAKKL